MKIKICGLTSAQDVEAVNSALPDYAGWVFTASRRQISAAQARDLRERLANSIVPVGVFAENSLAEIIALFDQKIIAVAQLHGTESPEYIEELKSARIALPIIKALAISRDATKNQLLIDRYANCAADFFLFDNERGGSGRSFDWAVLPTLRARLIKPSFLAGGLTPDLIARAKREIPDLLAVDISSGVESAGVKTAAQIAAAVAAARQ